MGFISFKNLKVSFRHLWVCLGFEPGGVFFSVLIVMCFLLLFNTFLLSLSDGDGLCVFSPFISFCLVFLNFRCFALLFIHGVEGGELEIWELVFF